MQRVAGIFLLLSPPHILLWWFLAGQPLSGLFFVPSPGSVESTMDAPFRMPPKPAACQLCGRVMCALTRHHLIPRARHRKKRNRRLFDRDEVRSRILWVCRPCHDHIHDVLSEQEMESAYRSREALLAHPAILRFVRWIAAKPEGFKP